MALAAGGDAVLLGGAYELLRVPLPSSNDTAGLQPRSLAAPGWDLLSMARSAGSAIMLLGTSPPGVAFATFNEDSGAVTPAEGPGGVAGAATAVGTGADGAMLVATSAGIEVMQRQNASAAAGEVWRAVRRLPADALAAKLSNNHIAAVSYDAAADVLLLLFDRAAPPVLRALRLRTGEVISDWVLPAGAAGGGGWSGLALAPDGTAFITRVSPPQLCLSLVLTRNFLVTAQCNTLLRGLSQSFDLRPLRRLFLVRLAGSWAVVQNDVIAARE
jgi:hypothetical protein